MWLRKLHQPSYTKPNLVAKILADKFGDCLCIGYQNWKPTLVLSFTTWLTWGLAVGSLVKSLPIKVAHTCKLDTIWVFVFLLTDCKCLHPIVITFNNTVPGGILHPMVWDTSVNLLALILKTINFFLPCKLIFWKSYQNKMNPGYFPLAATALKP